MRCDALRCRTAERSVARRGTFSALPVPPESDRAIAPARTASRAEREKLDFLNCAALCVVEREGANAPIRCCIICIIDVE